MVSRRDMLKWSALAAAFPGMIRPDQGSEPETQIFCNGDTIDTVFGPIEIKDWSIRMGKDDLQGFNKKSKGESGRITILDDTDRQEKYLGINERGWIDAPFDVDIVDGQYTFFTLPDDIFKVILLDHHRKNSSNLSLYPIRIESASVVKYAPSNKVYFEKDIVKEHRDPLMEELRLMSGTLGLSDVFIYNADNAHSLNLNKSKDFRGGPRYGMKRIKLPSTILESPKVEHEPGLTLFHEQAHSWLDYFSNKREFFGYMPKLARLSDAYWDMMGAAGVVSKFTGSVFRLEDRELLRNPLLFIFDESNYYAGELRELLVNEGHPQDNYAELFASGLSVMRFYTDEFLDTLRSLPRREQALVKEVGGAILSIFEVVVQRKHTRERIMPKYETLEKRFS